MPLSSIQSGRIICKLTGWTATNLRLQKLLYAACLNYIGEDKENPKLLIREDFEAWKYGPVQPELYVFCKDFNNRSISDVFPYVPDIKDKHPEEYEMLEKVVKWGESKTIGYLVAYAHRKGGAWERTIEKFGAENKPSIPYSFIQDELINEKRKDKDKERALAEQRN